MSGTVQYLYDCGHLAIILFSHVTEQVSTGLFFSLYLCCFQTDSFIPQRLYRIGQSGFNRLKTDG